MNLYNTTYSWVPRRAVALAALLFSVSTAAAEEPKNPMPRLDGKPADMTKPVQVYILLAAR